MSFWGENRIEKGREGRESGIPEVEALNHTLSKHGFYISQRKSDGGGVSTISCEAGSHVVLGLPWWSSG